MTRQTPGAVETLLHYHCCNEPHPRAGAPAVAADIEFFTDRGILVDDPGRGLTTTDRGAAWVTAICNVPIPRVAFLGADGKEITAEFNRAVIPTEGMGTS